MKTLLKTALVLVAIFAALVLIQASIQVR